jgi:hypothetical protein
MKILFINQILTANAIDSLAKKSEMVVIFVQNISWRNAVSKQVRPIHLRVTMFGISKLRQTFFPKNQTNIPQWMIGLMSVLRIEKPDIVFGAEIYHLFTWQCIRYTRRSKTRLFI